MSNKDEAGCGIIVYIFLSFPINWLLIKFAGDWLMMDKETKTTCLALSPLMFPLELIIVAGKIFVKLPEFFVDLM